jgi:hypothetical protein
MAVGDTPVPDPTTLTIDAVERAVQAERDYVNGQIGILEERLKGIDRATALLAATVGRVPTDVEQAVGHQADLTDERFTSVQRQFSERDVRSARESADNKIAVDAAFAAQKEAAAEQNKANTKAIDKSEEATTEAISKLAELFRTTLDAVKEQLDDLKQRVQAIESGRNGASENRLETRQVQQQVSASLIGWVTVGVFALSIVVAVIVKFA